MLVYLRGGSVRAATLEWKLQIKLAISLSHSILTTGQPVPAATLSSQASGGVTTGAPISNSLLTRPRESSTAKAGIEPRGRYHGG